MDQEEQKQLLMILGTVIVVLIFFMMMSSRRRRRCVGTNDRVQPMMFDYSIQRNPSPPRGVGSFTVKYPKYNMPRENYTTFANTSNHREHYANVPNVETVHSKMMFAHAGSDTSVQNPFAGSTVGNTFGYHETTGLKKLGVSSGGYASKNASIMKTLM